MFINVCFVGGDPLSPQNIKHAFEYFPMFLSPMNLLNMGWKSGKTGENTGSLPTVDLMLSHRLT